MPFATLRLSATILVISGLSANAQRTGVVDLGYARYQGTVDPATNTSIFLALQYAAAPIGNLRWAAPQPPIQTDAIVQATVQPPQCIQRGPRPLPNATQTVIEQRQAPLDSEDCLSLNIYTPRTSLPGAGNLPVVVWIHGGGYIIGSADVYNGQNLIEESGRDIVVVIIQYRLGLFGFLPGAAVKSGGALNAGLLDQEFALQWVQKHISKFGGDPNKVTIWGESSGAGAVLQQVVARNGEADPLFTGAIASSPFVPTQYKFDDVIPEKLFADTVQEANCTSSSDALECLRSADVSTLRAANDAVIFSAFYGTYNYAPVVDGTFIVRQPIDSLVQRKVNGKAVLSVHNANEGIAFVNETAAPLTNATAYTHDLFPALSGREVATVAAQYAKVGDTFEQLSAIMSESIFVCPAYFLATAFANRGFKACNSEFAIPPALHGDDVAYYWSDFPGWSSAYKNPVFIAGFRASFFNFIRALDPNTANVTPRWNSWSTNYTEMLFNKTINDQPIIQPVTTPGDVLDRCQFWQRLWAQ